MAELQLMVDTEKAEKQMLADQLSSVKVSELMICTVCVWILP